MDKQMNEKTDYSTNAYMKLTNEMNGWIDVWINEWV
jgi:hypothetical protein